MGAARQVALARDPFAPRNRPYARCVNLPSLLSTASTAFLPHGARIPQGFPDGPRLSPAHTTWKWLTRPYDFLEESARRYGTPFTMRLVGLPPIVMFADPEPVKQIFADDGETLVAGEFNQALRPFVGEHSLLLLDGKEHLRQRKLLTPPFHGERMEAYGQTMLDEADYDMDRWPVGRVFSLHGHMQRITLRVILRTVLGIEDASRLDEISIVMTKVLAAGTWAPLLLPFMQVDLGPMSPWGRFQRLQAESDRMLFDEVARRRREGDTSKRDVLSLLLAARDEHGEPMTDEELHDELTTLLVAGHETTATALAWAVRWILGNPSVGERLRAELREASANGALTPARIAKLELLDGVVRETLRLVPVIPIVGRLLKRPATIGGYDLPAGTGVTCSIYLSHRRPESISRPDEFDPDRFRGKRFSPNEIYPFGGGIRRCIGAAFAMYEMKMVLARVLLRTELALADEDIRPVRRSVTMMPSEGLRVRVTSRRPRTERPVTA